MSNHRNCEGATRRDCLKLGLGGLLAGGFVGALRGTAAAAINPKRQAKACILIWMDGGPSHYETFDPKPEAPIEFRGQFDAIATKTPGAQFSQHMKRLAATPMPVAGQQAPRAQCVRHAEGPRLELVERLHRVRSKEFRRHRPVLSVELAPARI